jgi:hypothetical protein
MAAVDRRREGEKREAEREMSRGREDGEDEKSEVVE